jgi:GH25 family lysozyme M1 (1,4-beta-N-acetylmuramidase)
VTPPPAPFTPLNGTDVSGYQSLQTVQLHAGADDFIIVKATEGKGLRIPSYSSYIAAVRQIGHAKPAAYGYAWPENGWAADFDNFWTYAGLRVGEAGCLDFEPWASSQPNADPATFPAYVTGWCDAFKARAGVDPLFYCPDWFVSKIKAAATSQQWERISALPFFKAGVNGGYVTDPSAGPGSSLGFATIAAWQWTDQPLDRDILFVPWSTIAATAA